MDSILLIVLVQAVIFGLFASFIAREKGREAGGWFFLGFFFSLLAIFALMAIPKRHMAPVQVVDPGQTKQAVCPFCREEINPEAIICKHCHSDLTIKRPIALQTLPTSQDIPEDNNLESFMLECPSCHETEQIPVRQKTNSDAYHKFSTEFHRLFNPHLLCKRCGTKIAYDPFNNGIFTGDYRRQLTSRSSRRLKLKWKLAARKKMNLY